MNAQVALQWESSSTLGYKGDLYLFGNSAVKYFYVIDTVAKNCRFFSGENYSPVSTMTSVGTQEYPYLIVPDMNNNGQPEVAFQDYGGSAYFVRIRDISTGADIYQWKEALNSYYLWSITKSAGSNLIKIVMWKTSLSTYQSSLVVYSLGVSASSVNQNEWNAVADEFILHQNYPNPFNPSTQISYTVAAPGAVRIEIFDMSGKSVSSVEFPDRQPGTHTYQWDGRDNLGKSVASGSYIYRVSVNGVMKEKKMLLVR
jgi:hypothetical protein